VKALVVRLSSIGDVVHTLPALAALAGKGWQAGWIVEPPARPLLEAHPLLAQLVIAPPARGFDLSSARQAVGELRGGDYDVALDFQGLWKSAGWARLSGARRTIGFARAWRREGASAMLVGDSVSVPPQVKHVIDKNLALQLPLGIDALGSREFPLPPTNAAAERVDRELGSLGLGSYVILNPGGGWASKLWPPERFGAVALALRERGLASIVSWGPGEEALADRVVAAAQGGAVRSFPTSLLEFAELARRARLVVAGDTGPLHLACALGTPVVGLYGPTDPARNGPFSPADRVVRRVPSCAPCHRRRCPTHDGIMDTITLADVMEAIDQRLGLAAGGRRGGG